MRIGAAWFAAGALIAVGIAVPLLKAQAPPAVGELEQVWIVRSDGQELRRITNGRAHRNATWAPDSRRLFPVAEVLEAVEERVPPTPHEEEDYPNRPGVRRYEKTVRPSAASPPTTA